jgi:hypothetical protein
MKDLTLWSQEIDFTKVIQSVTKQMNKQMNKQIKIASPKE